MLDPLASFLKSIFVKRPGLAAACDDVLEAVNVTELTDGLDGMLIDLSALEAELQPLLDDQTISLLKGIAYDSDIPLPARQAYGRVVDGVMAALVLIRIFTTGRRVEPWLILALTSTFDVGMRALGEGAMDVVPAFFRGGVQELERLFPTAFEDTRRYVAYILASEAPQSEPAPAKPKEPSEAEVAARCEHIDKGKPCEKFADTQLECELPDGSVSVVGMCRDCKQRFLVGWDRMQEDAAQLRARGVSKPMLDRIMCARVARGVY